MQLVWIETPTNPTLKIVDIQKVAEVVHKRDNIILVVDNTFLSSYFQVNDTPVRVTKTSSSSSITFACLNRVETSGIWSRHRHAFSDQIHERPHGCDHGRGHDQLGGPAQPAALSPER